MQMSCEISSMAELRRSCSGDGLVLWASQGLSPGVPSQLSGQPSQLSGQPSHLSGQGWRRVRAWRRGDAVAVAAPFLSCRDRLAIHGPADQVAPLVRDVLAEVGPTFRLLGLEDLVDAVAERIDELAVLRRFGWMETARPAPRKAGGSAQPADGARWLDCSWSAPIAELLAETYPGSYARPGLTGVRRWAGAVTADGTLGAVTADAWSAPEIGYLAGVVVRPQLQGQGYAAAAFRLVLDTLVAEHGRAALMVARDNAPAVRLYRRCGMTWRSLASAGVAPRHRIIRGGSRVAERVGDGRSVRGSAR